MLMNHRSDIPRCRAHPRRYDEVVASLCASAAASLVVLLAASCQPNPGTGETTEDPAGTRAPGASPAPGRRLEAEVVSTNPAAQVITVRPVSAADQSGAASGAVETALPVQGAAASMLGMLRSGDRVALTCEAVVENAVPGGAPPRGYEPEGQGTVAVDAGALGVPCPAVIQIEKHR
jgi:hypothetical protein